MEGIPKFRVLGAKISELPSNTVPSTKSTHAWIKGPEVLAVSVPTVRDMITRLHHGF